MDQYNETTTTKAMTQSWYLARRLRQVFRKLLYPSKGTSSCSRLNWSSSAFLPRLLSSAGTSNACQPGLLHNQNVINKKSKDPLGADFLLAALRALRPIHATTQWVRNNKKSQFQNIFWSSYHHWNYDTSLGSWDIAIRIFCDKRRTEEECRKCVFQFGKVCISNQRIDIVQFIKWYSKQ